MTDSRISALLAILILLAASAPEAYAKGGIVVTSGTTQQTGDPTYEYIFTVNLLAGSILPSGGFFTIYDLPALTATATTSAPNLQWTGSVQGLGLTPIGALVNDNPNLFNTTWQWNGPGAIVAPANSDYNLGTFIVGSTTELAAAPAVAPVFASSLDGSTASNQGSLFINSVPEPSSVVLLLAGAGMLPLYWFRDRRSQA
jgi:hypothetical protein